MKILLANANTTAAVTEICAASARAAAAPGTEIVAVTPHFGPAIISSRAENAIAAHGIIDALAEHHGGCDAAILAVSYDTALTAARQLLPIPVIGMTEAACLTLSGLALVAASPYDAASDPEGVAAKVAEAAEGLAREGADSVILGGAALAGIGGRIQARVPVPLIDGIAAAVKFAEGLVALNLPKPGSGSFAAPSGRASLGLGEALAGMLSRR